MPTYEELLAKAKGQREARQAFEKTAAAKVVELHNALAEALYAPIEAIVAVPIKAHEGEIQVSDDYVLEPHGLRFGIKISFDSVSVTSICCIAPKGNRLILQPEGRAAIDVTNIQGVAEWCDWMEQLCESKISDNLNGHFSAMLTQKP